MKRKQPDEEESVGTFNGNIGTTRTRVCAKLLSHGQLFAIVWAVACQAPLFMAFSRQDYWSGLSCHPPGDVPYSGIKLVLLMSPALAVGFFTTSANQETTDYWTPTQF